MLTTWPRKQQADGEIREDQLLNFLVNEFTGAFTLGLGDNAEIDPEDIFEVIVGACADGTSVSTLCEHSEDAPSANDGLYHLRTKFNFDTAPASVISCFSGTCPNVSPSR